MARKSFDEVDRNVGTTERAMPATITNDIRTKP